MSTLSTPGALERAIRQAIEKEVGRAIEEEAEKAAERAYEEVRARLRKSLGNLVMAVMTQYSVEWHGRDIRITVRNEVDK